MGKSESEEFSSVKYFFQNASYKNSFIRKTRKWFFQLKYELLDFFPLFIYRMKSFCRCVKKRWKPSGKVWIRRTFSVKSIFHNKNHMSLHWKICYCRKVRKWSCSGYLRIECYIIKNIVTLNMVAFGQMNKSYMCKYGFSCIELKILPTYFCWNKDQK